MRFKALGRREGERGMGNLSFMLFSLPSFTVSCCSFCLFVFLINFIASPVASFPRRSEAWSSFFKALFTALSSLYFEGPSTALEADDCSLSRLIRQETKGISFSDSWTTIRTFFRSPWREKISRTTSVQEVRPTEQLFTFLWNSK